MFERENETVALAGAGVSKASEAMRTAVETFATMYGFKIAPSRAWQLYALYNQALLVQEPTNHAYLNEMMACHTRAGEEIKFEQLRSNKDSVVSLAPVPPAPDVIDSPAITTEPAAPLPRQDSPSRAAPEIQPTPISGEIPRPKAAPVMRKVDEVIVEGKIVKEWLDRDDYRSGYWRCGYPYRIVVTAQPGQYDAPEYFVHCAHKPTLEMFSQHADLYKKHLCFVRVKYSNGEESTDITKEYVQKLNNPQPVGRTEMQQFEDDDWSEDAPWRIVFHDVRVNRPSYVYFNHEPGPALVKKYHRVKHHAVVQSRADWIADAKRHDLNASMS